MAVARILTPWNRQPHIAARVRQSLNPVVGMQPGGWGLLDTMDGSALTVNSTIGIGISEQGAGAISVYNNGAETAISKTLVGAAAGHPYTFVGVARYINAASGDRCISSLATTGDKTFRVYATGSTGGLFAQHIGATTFANATITGVWNYGTTFVVVAVFRSTTSVSCYGRGSVALYKEATTTTNVGTVVAPTIFSVNGYKGSINTAKFDGVVAMAEWLRYIPSEQEIRQWLDNPWSVYEDREVYDWRGAAAPSGAPTLSDIKAASITATSVQGTYDYAF